MTPREKRKWVNTHLTIIAADILALALVTHLLAAPLFAGHHLPPTLAKSADLPTSQPASLRNVATDHYQPPRAPPPPSNPNETTIGPTGISNRYRLQSVERKKESPGNDVLVVSLRIESLAMDPLVSPFESDMLEIHTPGQPPIKPNKPFRSPIPGGNSRNQDIAFNVPSTLSLDRATLQIHYYNYQGELPLKPAVVSHPEHPLSD